MQLGTNRKSREIPAVESFPGIPETRRRSQDIMRKMSRFVFIIFDDLENLTCCQNLLSCL